jgi:5-methylcytosine-specific restriction endonuclease McrA
VELPEPNSDELYELVTSPLHRGIYRELYERRGDPPTVFEIRAALGINDGQQHFDKRVRELRDHFKIATERRGKDTVYRLVERNDESLVEQSSVNKTDRAWVLRNKRCAQCGRTPEADGVKLHVDHKIPRSWGGGNDRENLQALCAECNEGKRDYYSSIESEAPEIIKAFAFDEPHRRIGEALKASFPNALRSDLLESVASAKQYQEDWQKRTRELRTLGWKIEVQRKKEQGRSVAYYRLSEPPPPWPEGNIRAEISRIERLNKLQNRG